MSQPCDLPFTCVLRWPPTGNHYKLPRIAKTQAGKSFIHWYLSEEAQAYQRYVKDLVFEGKLPKNLPSPFNVTMIAYPPDRRRRDIASLEKVVMDSFAYAGVIGDDYDIWHLAVTRGLVRPGGELHMTISKFDVSGVKT